MHFVLYYGSFFFSHSKRGNIEEDASEKENGASGRTVQCPLLYTPSSAPRIYHVTWSEVRYQILKLAL